MKRKTISLRFNDATVYPHEHSYSIRMTTHSFYPHYSLISRGNRAESAMIRHSDTEESSSSWTKVSSANRQTKWKRASRASVNDVSAKQLLRQQQQQRNMSEDRKGHGGASSCCALLGLYISSRWMRGNWNEFFSWWLFGWFGMFNEERRVDF